MPYYYKISYQSPPENEPVLQSYLTQKDVWTGIIERFYLHARTAIHDILTYTQQMVPITIQDNSIRTLVSQFHTPYIEDTLRSELQQIHTVLHYRLTDPTTTQNTLHIYWFLSPQDTSLSTVDRLLIQRLFASLHTVLRYYEFQGQTIPFYIYPSSFTKRRDPTKNIFDPSQVNSGVTTLYGDPSRNYIAIHRREECERVAIHELLHFLRFDPFLQDKRVKNILNTLAEDSQPKHRLPVDTNYVFGEIIADTGGILWNAVCAMVYASVQTDVERERIWYAEYRYVLQLRDQWVANEYLCNSVSQTTGGFTYYVLKAMTWESIGDFLREVYHLDEPNVFKIYSWDNESLVMNFIKWVYQHYITYGKSRGDCPPPTTDTTPSYSLRMSHVEVIPTQQQ